MKREANGVTHAPAGPAASPREDAQFLRDIRSTWQARAVSQAELDGAWRRHQLRPRAPRKVPRTGLVGVGVAVGVVSSLATAAVVVNWSRVGTSSAPTASQPHDPAPAARRPVGSKSPAKPRVQAPDVAPESVPEPAVPQATATGIAAPALHPAAPVVPTVPDLEPAGPPPASRPNAVEREPQTDPGAAESTTAVKAVPPATARFPSTSAWERANAALERDDRRAAERALAELANSSDTATRDAAALARAQLWVSSGEVERARPVLEGLSRRGATELIRERATALLQRMR